MLKGTAGHHMFQVDASDRQAGTGRLVCRADEENSSSVQQPKSGARTYLT